MPPVELIAPLGAQPFGAGRAHAPGGRDQPLELYDFTISYDAIAWSESRWNERNVINDAPAGLTGVVVRTRRWCATRDLRREVGTARASRGG